MPQPAIVEADSPPSILGSPVSGRPNVSQQDVSSATGADQQPQASEVLDSIPPADSSEPSPSSPQIVEPTPLSAAEELRREFEKARAIMTPAEAASGEQLATPPVNAPDAGLGMPGIVAEVEVEGWTAADEILRRELESRPPRTPPPGFEAALTYPESPDNPEPIIRPPSTLGAPISSEPKPASTMPESFSGRLYLMFPASMGQDGLGTVWEILDDVAGSGAIADSRLLSGDDGIQFTLELGSKLLLVEDLRLKMPGAEFVVLDSDRIKVNWERLG